MNLTEILLIAVSIAFAITLGMLFFGNRGATAPAPSGGQRAPRTESEERVRTLQGELDRRSKELDAQRKQVHELKGELKVNKRKLFEQREAEKAERDRLRARTESERELAAQLEQNRIELAEALAEAERLRAQLPAGRGRPVAAPAPEIEKVVEAPAAPIAETAPLAAPAPVAAPEPRHRELNEEDQARLAKMEAERERLRLRAEKAEKELKRIKGRTEAQARLANATRADAELLKDKFKALEKRLNRTLLEKDLLVRAIRDLEKKAGVLAERTELTPEEIATSDRAVEERADAQAEAEREALARTQETAPSTEKGSVEGEHAEPGEAVETSAPETLPTPVATEVPEQKA